MWLQQWWYPWHFLLLKGLKEVMFQERLLLSCEKEDSSPWPWSGCRKHVANVHKSPSGLFISGSTYRENLNWDMYIMFTEQIKMEFFLLPNWRSLLLQLFWEKYALASAGTFIVCWFVHVQLTAKLRCISQKQNTFFMDKVGDWVLTAHSVDCTYANLSWRIMFGLGNFAWI